VVGTRLSDIPTIIVFSCSLVVFQASVTVSYRRFIRAFEFSSVAFVSGAFVVKFSGMVPGESSNVRSYDTKFLDIARAGRKEFYDFPSIGGAVLKTNQGNVGIGTFQPIIKKRMADLMLRGVE
jgi:hypothetical protein